MPANTTDNFNPVSTKLESTASIQKIHSVSSNVRQKGKSISKIPSKRREKLDFDRYLVGRSFQLFKSAVKVPATLEFYRRNLYYFCDSVHKSTKQITELHGPFKKVKGKNRPNIEGIQDLQKIVENYALSLQERVDRKEIKPSSCVARMPAVKLFGEMNDMVLNWRKIGIGGKVVKVAILPILPFRQKDTGIMSTFLDARASNSPGNLARLWWIRLPNPVIPCPV